MGHPLTLSQRRMDQSILTCTPPPSIKGTSTVTAQVSFLPFFSPNSSSWIRQTYQEEDAEDGVREPRSAAANHWPWATFLCPTREARGVCVRGVSAARRVRVWRRGRVWGCRGRLNQRSWDNGENLSLHHETELHLCSHRHDGECCSPQRSVSSFQMSWGVGVGGDLQTSGIIQLTALEASAPHHSAVLFFFSLGVLVSRAIKHAWNQQNQSDLGEATPDFELIASNSIQVSIQKKRWKREKTAFMYHKNCSKAVGWKRAQPDWECCVACSLQAWSITYVSWLTFVFLIWSCTLWMVRDRRRYAMLSSPFMVAYGNLLIVLQYIWSFENMEPVSGLFVEKKNPFHSLSSKVWKRQCRARQPDRA